MDAGHAPVPKQGIGVRRHGAAIFVAGVRGDQQLRRAPGLDSSAGADEIVDDMRAQRTGRGGGEQTVDDGFAQSRHRARLLTLNVDPRLPKINQWPASAQWQWRGPE